MRKSKSVTINHTMPQRMLDAAICAYAVDSLQPFKPKSQYWNPIKIVGTPATFIAGTGRVKIDAGFIGVTSDNWVVLSLRGTLLSFDDWDTFVAWVKDWLQDDETRPVHWDVVDPNTNGLVHIGHVEKGFHRAMMKLWPQMKVTLDKIQWSKVKGIQITGHSKGAAMTFLAAALVKIFYPQANEIVVNAFAAPLAGRPDFASWYRTAGLDATTTRYQRIYDLVPFLPPTEAWDIFDHLGKPKTWDGAAIKAFLEGLGLTLYGGYEEVGSVTFLPGEPPPTCRPVVGPSAVTAARNAIVHAVEYGPADRIADAHSAACSYWPATFQTHNSDPLCKKK